MCTFGENFSMPMSSKRKALYLLAVLLVFPALLINLGIMTFIDDEGIRSLVAMEMDLSGQYIAPTLHGAFYYNKPPLFNWVLLVFFKLAGVYNEWVARFPTVLALLAYAATVFYFFRRHYGVKVGFLAAFLLITCGRVLFWDSMLALIDITFSWVIFTLFMVIYHEFEGGRYGRLFLLSYLLAAIGFMLKGLPALVFQATTLLVYFTYRSAFRRLFSIQHFAGIGLLALILGSYYLAYHQYNDLGVVFQTLFTESAKRTVVKYGIWESVLHFLSFPFEMVYHFLPWSVMVVYFFRRDVVKLIRADRFQAFLMITFLSNILVYWLSPEVYPRYLLMLAPLIFGVYLHLHTIHKAEKTRTYRWVADLFLVLSVITGLLCFLPFGLARSQVWSFWWFKSLLTGLAILGLSRLYYRWREERLLVFVSILLVLRIAFNWFVLPDRNLNDSGDLARQSSQRIGEVYRDVPLFLYGDTHMQTTNSFYLTQKRGSIIPREKDNFGPEDRVIIDPLRNPELDEQPLDSFYIRMGRRYYHIVIPNPD